MDYYRKTREKNAYYQVRRTLITSGVAYVNYGGTAIIVVEPDKVQEVKDKFKEFSKNLDYKGKSAYLRQLLGDEYFEIKKKELETNNENFKAAFGPGSVRN